MADHGGNGGGGEVVDHPEDQGGPMEVEMGDQLIAVVITDTSAAVEGGGDGEQGRDQEVGGGAVRRATEEEPRATVGANLVNLGIEPLGSSTVVGGLVAIGGSLGDAGGSGARGDVLEPSESPAESLGEGQGYCGRGGGVHEGSARVSRGGCVV